VVTARTDLALFDRLDEGFCVLERATTAVEGQLDFRYVAANPALETQSGVVGVVGRTMREVLPGEPEDWYLIFDEVLRTGRSTRFQQSLGTYGRVLELYAFCVDPEARDEVAVVFTDITARVRAEARERTLLAELSQVALTLQRAILGPVVLPEGFVVRYEPAVSQVGGDWYDVVALPGGRYGVVVGDVVGHGLDAAAVMGQLRSAARALLLQDGRPARVLESLDRFAALLPGARCTTVFCAVVDPERGEVVYASAGHLPAMVAEADGHSRLLDQALFVPLGVLPSARREETTAVLPAGATLLLYTDGLVERRGESLDVGLRRAAAALVAHRESPLEEVADRLARDLVGEEPDDDIALLVYRR